MKDPLVWDRSNFAKVRSTCQKARANNVQYVWIDTCCIDKSSSAELTEAINSMFYYYHHATVCYASLSDLSATQFFTTFDSDVACESNKLNVLAACRWFNRGWTLQELIAPTEVRFYANDWTFLSLRSTMVTLLATITGIQPRALDWPRESIRHTATLDTILDSFSTAQRMSWAAKRQTTRLEDIAYSLLGIFGVKMPLLYGEGKTAFLRLQMEIIKFSTDQSIFAWEHLNLQSDNSNSEQREKLLAPHPMHYAAVAKVIRTSPIQGVRTSEDMSAPQSAFDITNEGLRITLPIIKPARIKDAHFTANAHYAVLNCSSQGDLMGPLAIRVERLVGVGSNVYRIGSRASRISVIPAEVVHDQAIYTAVTILTKGNPSDFFPPSAMYQGLHVLYRTHAWSNAGGVEIADTWPRASDQTEINPDFQQDSDAVVTIRGFKVLNDDLTMGALLLKAKALDGTTEEECHIVFCSRIAHQQPYSPHAQHWVWILPALDPDHRSLESECRSRGPFAMGAPHPRASIDVGAVKIEAKLRLNTLWLRHWALEIEVSSLQKQHTLPQR
ncbi:hypothetical protein LTR17_015042 [Elasticomyces elasticus]|nr:hypothetical protein LTR17_015042 [Elasticomyces elasticus]